MLHLNFRLLTVLPAKKWRKGHKNTRKENGRCQIGRKLRIFHPFENNYFIYIFEYFWIWGVLLGRVALAEKHNLICLSTVLVLSKLKK